MNADNNENLRSRGRLRAILIGAAVGLILGFAAYFFAASEKGAPQSFEYIDRFGRRGHITVDNFPTYVVLPLLGAFVGAAWFNVRNVFGRR